MEEIVCKKCGSVDDYTTSQSGVHIKATCNSCDNFIKFISQPDKEFLMPFGKYKDRPLVSLTSIEELKYLEWALANMTLGKNIKDRIVKHLRK